MEVLIRVFIVFVFTGILLWFLERMSLKFQVVDAPEENKRKIHTRHIPVLGEVGIFGGVLLGLLISGYFEKALAPITAGSLLVVIGLIDDAFDLNARIKLLFQLIAAGILLWMSGLIPAITPVPAVNIVFGVLFVVVVINAANMNDGFDGQLSVLSIAALASVLLILKLPLFTYFIVPVLIFLVFNLRPARMFLGDAGSMFIGVIVAYAGLVLMNYLGFWKGIFLFGLIFYIPLFDLVFAIGRRLENNTGIMTADKDHLHHRLLARIKSHGRVLFYYLAASILLGLFAFVLSLIELRIFLIFNLIIIIFTVIIIYLLTKSKLEIGE